MLAKTIELVKKDFVNEGILIGMQKGKLAGIREGMQKGIIDGKKETAMAMKKKGIDIKTISEVTGLSQAEIRKMKG